MKRILFILLFSGICFSSFAQVSVRPGLKLGVNFSTINNSDFDRRAGLLVGAFANVKLARFYSLQPELLYSEQGGKSTMPGQSDLVAKYISFILSNKFYVFSEVPFYLMTGPSIDVYVDKDLLRAEYNLDYTPIDFGLHLGLGYEFNSGIGLEARYKQGIVGIDTHENSGNFNFFSYSNLFNSMFQFTLSYKFDY